MDHAHEFQIRLGIIVVKDQEGETVAIVSGWSNPDDNTRDDDLIGAAESTAFLEDRIVDRYVATVEFPGGLQDLRRLALVDTKE